MRNEAPYEVIPRAASSSPSFHHLPRRATPPSKYSHQVITLDCRTSENRHLISRLSTLAPRPPTTTSASAHADYQTMPKSQGSRPELPPNHPMRRLQQPGVRLALLLLSPFVALALVLWGVVGWFLTLPPRSVAVVTVAGSWVLYLCIPDIPVRLIDWPIVLTVAMALGVVLPVKPVGRANRGAVRAAHLVLSLGMIVYGVLRVSLTDLKDGTTEKHIVDALAVLCCVTPAWLAICSLKLWLPADEQLLEEFERKVYEQYIVTEFSLLKVAGLGTVHVPYCGEATHVPPRNLVLVHGYLAGNGFWAANLQALAKCFNVYAVEWKGIGRSDRPKFNPKTDKEMDDFFVESLEDWRREIQLDRFILCGHSMGGMYATYYSEKYSQHIEHMILVSPAGVNSSGVKPEELNWFIRLAATFYITPMSIVRFTGPYGLRMVQWIMRSRIAWTPPTNIIRSGELDFDLITAYCYHNWALGPSGDRAVYTHLHPGASAPRRSLDSILVPGKIQVPLTIMYGGGPDWMNSEYGRAVIERLENVHYAKFRLVPLSGHQVFMDNPTDFNSVLIDAVREEERSSGFNN